MVCPTQRAKSRVTSTSDDRCVTMKGFDKLVQIFNYLKAPEEGVNDCAYFRRARNWRRAIAGGADTIKRNAGWHNRETICK